MKTIEERIASVQAGEIEQFSEVVEQFQQRIFIYCLRLLGNQQDAEDAAQDIFVKAYQSIQSYRPTANFSSWLYKIAHHHCLNLLRRRKLQINIQRLFKTDIHTDSPELLIDRRAISPPLEKALAAIKPEDRSLLILSVFEEKTTVQLSEILGISTMAAKKRVSRIKLKMRDLIETNEEDEPWTERMRPQLKTRI